MTSRSATIDRPSRGHARAALLDAAIALVRRQGWAATGIEQLCAAAGVSKGAFFHHFSSKDALGAAAVEHWSQVTGDLFAAAPYHGHADPHDRVLGYIDFRCQILEGGPAEFTCLAGTMVQEAYGSSDAIRAACEASIGGHAATLEADIAAALSQRGIAGLSARSLALHTQAVLQGAFILAKASGGPEVARESVVHLKRYFTLLFAGEEAG